MVTDSEESKHDSGLYMQVVQIISYLELEGKNQAAFLQDKASQLTGKQILQKVKEKLKSR